MLRPECHKPFRHVVATNTEMYSLLTIIFQITLRSVHWALTTVMLMPCVLTHKAALHVPAMLGSLEMEQIAVSDTSCTSLAQEAFIKAYT